MMGRIMLKKYSMMLFVAVMLVILQQAVFSRIQIFDHSLDLVYVFLVSFALMRDDVESVLFALMCGLIRDSFFPYIFGLNTILYISSAYLITHINRRIYKDTIVIPILVTFGASIYKGLVYFSFLFISAIRFDFLYQVVDTLIYESLINAVGSILIFRVAKRIVNIRIMQQEWKF